MELEEIQRKFLAAAAVGNTSEVEKLRAEGLEEISRRRNILAKTNKPVKPLSEQIKFYQETGYMSDGVASHMQKNRITGLRKRVCE
jgi:hypothetical protein